MDTKSDAYDLGAIEKVMREAPVIEQQIVVIRLLVHQQITMRTANLTSVGNVGMDDEGKFWLFYYHVFPDGTQSETTRYRLITHEPFVKLWRKKAHKMIGEMVVPWHQVAHYPGMGTSRVHIRCGHCQTVNRIYLWSWAGNGFYRCKGCGRKLVYLKPKG